MLLGLPCNLTQSNGPIVKYIAYLPPLPPPPSKAFLDLTRGAMFVQDSVSTIILILNMINLCYDGHFKIYFLFERKIVIFPQIIYNVYYVFNCNGNSAIFNLIHFNIFN